MATPNPSRHRTVYSLKWIDGAATVRVDSSERAVSVVLGGDQRGRMLGVQDYRTPGAIGAEVNYIARKTNAHLTIEEVPG